MRGFPPTYLNGGPTAGPGPHAANPHLAATYMANLNKAAAYAAAAAAVNTIPRHYTYQPTASHEDLSAEGRMRQQNKDPFTGNNIYAVSIAN